MPITFDKLRTLPEQVKQNTDDIADILGTTGGDSDIPQRVTNIEAINITQTQNITNNANAIGTINNTAIPNLQAQISANNLDINNINNTAIPYVQTQVTNNATALQGKQNTLITGQNLATINGIDLLAGGNINLVENTLQVYKDPSMVANVSANSSVQLNVSSGTQNNTAFASYMTLRANFSTGPAYKMLIPFAPLNLLAGGNSNNTWNNVFYFGTPNGNTAMTVNFAPNIITIFFNTTDTNVVSWDILSFTTLYTG